LNGTHEAFMPRVVAVIPARHRSIRFPGKPLADLHGRPIIHHVCEQVAKAPYLDEIVVATDDERIVDAVESIGFTALMTSPAHPTGTDRVAEAVSELDADIVVNVQGDEPLIEPAMIAEVLEPVLGDDTVAVTTLMHPVTETADALDEDVVKVVTDLAGNVMCFSRSRLPFPKGPVASQMYKQVGMYAFRRAALEAFVGWEPTPLELTESVELFRFLEHGWTVRAARTEHHTVAVDTPEDLERVRAILDDTKEGGRLHA
jgi:3-deoxy-D-manno-octulosonate cytidylyltransferase